MPVLTLRAFVVCKKGETYLPTYLPTYLRLNLSTTPDLKFQKPQHCTVLDPITGNLMASSFCRILDKFFRRAKPIRIIGDYDNQRPNQWSSSPLPHFNSWHRLISKTKKIKKQQLCQMGCTCKKSDLVFVWGKNTNFNLFNTDCWGKYLDLITEKWTDWITDIQKFQCVHRLGITARRVKLHRSQWIFLNVLLTVHLSIILVINQLEAQNFVLY